MGLLRAPRQGNHVQKREIATGRRRLDDYRPAFVLDDVEDVTLEGLQLPSRKGQIVVRGVKGLQVPEGMEVMQGE